MASTNDAQNICQKNNIDNISDAKVIHSPSIPVSSSPPPQINSDVERTPWTKRLSKTIHRHSGSFLHTLVPFRKNNDCPSDKTISPNLTPRQKRRASAAPAIFLATVKEDNSFKKAILSVEAQRRSSAIDRSSVINQLLTSSLNIVPWSHGHIYP
ncbi:unnamed protein product [Dracunculus medinensis]|uniref:Uncharacterized protein n=1 Tax=Dracunculus medinensis TaxID=318479 RepID=A0A0N4U163_DRAME|nr:unnamed protein product [Dracunculus medinensis]